MADIKNTYGTGLVEHWGLEETSGNRTGSFAGTVLVDVNTVSYGAGKIGTNAADFESSNSEYMYVNSDMGLSPTGDMSVSFWIKFETSTIAQNLFWFNNDNSSSDSQWYCDFYQGGANVIRLVDTRENIAQYTWSSVTSGTWYHIVATIKYNTASIGQNLYINGSLVASSTSGTVTGCTVQNKFYFGASQDPTRYVDGLMDELTIWSRELSSADVAGIYNGGSGIPYEDASPSVAPIPPQIITW